MAQQKKDMLDLWLEKNTEMFSPVIPYTYRVDEECFKPCNQCLKKYSCPRAHDVTPLAPSSDKA